MHIRSLSIRNLRVFAEADIQFPPVTSGDAFSNVHLFLGTNGSGKTSLLRAIALACVAEVLPSSGLRPYSLVRRTQPNPDECIIKASFDLNDQDWPSHVGLNTRNSGRRGPIESELRLLARSGFNDSFGSISYPKIIADELWDDRSPAVLVLGYGATRRVESSASSSPNLSEHKGRTVRYARVAGLFEDHLPLLPLSAWLPEYASRNPGRHTQVVRLVNELLADVAVELLPKAVDGEYLFQMGGSKLPLGALSDGYRSYIGWISDLLFHVCKACPDGKRLKENEGIVLVDEIDLHLHPQWQRVVIPRLSRVLPHLQFFFTSHSPLVVGSVPSNNVYVVQMESVGQGASIVPSPMDVYGWSSDQILGSPLFGETEARNAEATDKIRSTSALARKGDRNAAIDLMQVLAEGLESRGASSFADFQSAAKPVASKKPAVKKSAFKKPVAKKAAAVKPALKKPAAKKPAVKKSAVKKSAASDLASRKAV